MRNLTDFRETVETGVDPRLISGINYISFIRIKNLLSLNYH